MIRLMKTRDGQQAQELTEYPENWDMNDAMEELTKRYRTELSEKDSTMYLESLQIELDLLNEGLDEVEDAEQIESNKKYVNNIDWRGAGYYSTDGDCLLLDGELKSYIHEDVWTWELVEVPNDIIISDSDLFSTISGFLKAEFLVIKKDGSLCLMELNQRFDDDTLELFRVRLCSNLEEHNAFVENNKEDDGYSDDNFFETIKEKILDTALQFNRENEVKININIW